jgi:hypothetical protein
MSILEGFQHGREFFAHPRPVQVAARHLRQLQDCTLQLCGGGVRAGVQAGLQIIKLVLQLPLALLL